MRRRDDMDRVLLPHIQECMMTRFLRQLAIAAASLLLVGSAYAGPVSDFEKSMRSAYADYRGALFQTNANNRDEAVRAVNDFREKWSTLARANAKAPPQYADDASYGATLAKVSAIVEAAAAQATAGKLAEAHGTLEAVRDQIGDLHERNGVIAFSDRMNAYHAKMEQILAKDYGGFSATGLGDLREDAAVLAYLAADIAAHPPADSADASYRTLLDGMNASVTALGLAAKSAEAGAAKRAVDGLKVPYSKFFLKFG
jgi:hypothetical protein